MEILGLFCHLIALILGRISVKVLRVTKNVKETKIKVLWGKLESKNSSRDNNSVNI